MLLANFFPLTVYKVALIEMTGYKFELNLFYPFSPEMPFTSAQCYLSSLPISKQAYVHLSRIFTVIDFGNKNDYGN